MQGWLPQLWSAGGTSKAHAEASHWHGGKAIWLLHACSKLDPHPQPEATETRREACPAPSPAETRPAAGFALA